MRLKYQRKRRYVDAFYYNGDNLHGLLEYLKESPVQVGYRVAWGVNGATLYVNNRVSEEQVQTNVYVVKSKDGSVQQWHKSDFEECYEPVR